MKTMIAIPTIRDARPPIWQIVSYTGLQRPPATDFRISTAHEGIAENRNRLAQHAIDEGYTHILFLDDDVLFPVDGLPRMLGWRHPVVSGVYFLRLGCISVGNFGEGFAWTPLRWPSPHEIDYCTMAAGGCLLLDTRLFEHLSRPWWRFTDQCSEDVFFAHKLRAELGIPILADLHVRCGHGTAVWLEPDGRATVKMDPRKVHVKA